MDKSRIEVSETNFLKMWQVYRTDGENEMAEQLSVLRINDEVDKRNVRKSN